MGQSMPTLIERALHSRSRLVLGWFVLCCLSAGFGALVAADDLTASVRQHLAAGEFGPALVLAKGIPDQAGRDHVLQEVARAQAASGAFRSSYATAYGIDSDPLRTETLNELGPSRSGGARGGAALADFDSLIELITSTIDPDSWTENGGAGAIEPFPTGVYVDTSGLMQRHELDPSGGLDATRTRANRQGGNRDVRKEVPLRKVSLIRLEKHLQRLHSQGRGPDEAMRVLAGLRRIQYVFVYPETRDVVLAGPAGDWGFNPEGRLVNTATGRPVLQLDDLVVLLRNSFGEMQGRFSCAIVPRQENLAATKAYLEETAAQPLKPAQRGAWLAGIRDRLGRQDIEIKGLDPQTRVARVIAEADYHMKLIGMGLEDGTVGVPSYLDSLASDPQAAQKPLNVLRWWFTLNYETLRATPDRLALEIRGPAAKVLSENELLTARGERVHTGAADLHTSQFARNFTAQLEPLAVKYPVYAELQNVFDLAIVAAYLRVEDIPGQLDWTLPHFRPSNGYRVALAAAPREVESVLNHRVINQRQIVAGVSGGVAVDTRSVVRRDALRTDDYGLLQGTHGNSAPADPDRLAWWWD